VDNKNDISVIKQVLDGKTDEFRLIVDRYKNMSYNLAFRICGNREDAEEISQDAFLKAFKSLGNFKMNSSFATWLYRIVYNTTISYLRVKKGNTISLEDFPTETSYFLRNSESEEDADKEYRNSLVNFALQKISEEERGLISLYYFNEMNIDEISDVTGINNSNIKVKLFRARQKMLEIIEKVEKRNTVSHEK
jgi:RNA polymerase sigma factor (sigma-70 family)